MSGPAVIAAVFLVAMLFLVFRSWRRGRSSPPPHSEQDKVSVVPASVAPVESFTQTLNRLSNELAPVAEKTAHPRELTELPEFQRVVDAFRGPQASLVLLRQYIFGDNWPLSCAALAALRLHPERSSLLGGLLAQLAKVRPWALYFALDCISSGEPRPPVGAPVVVAPNWWPENLVIPDLFREYFAQRERMGDIAAFGDYLETRHAVQPKQITDLLEKIDHPFAATLLEQLRSWQTSRIDRDYLTSFGRLWVEDSEEKLLVEPSGASSWIARRQPPSTTRHDRCSSPVSRTSARRHSSSSSVHG